MTIFVPGLPLTKPKTYIGLRLLFRNVKLATSTSPHQSRNLNLET